MTQQIKFYVVCFRLAVKPEADSVKPETVWSTMAKIAEVLQSNYLKIGVKGNGGAQSAARSATGVCGADVGRMQSLEVLEEPSEAPLLEMHKNLDGCFSQLISPLLPAAPKALAPEDEKRLADVPRSFAPFRHAVRMPGQLRDGPHRLGHLRLATTARRGEERGCQRRCTADRGAGLVWFY